MTADNVKLTISSFVVGLFGILVIIVFLLPTPALADIDIGSCTFDTPTFNLGGEGNILGYSGDCTYAGIVKVLGTDCVADRSKCSPGENLYIADALERACGGTAGVCPTSFTASEKSSFTGGRAAAEAAAKAAGTCSFYGFDFYKCIWYPATSGIGAFLMFIGIKVLVAAAGIFETSIKYLIVEFGSLMANSIEQGINVGWTALRDIANIVIIGLFVFIAVNMILGVQQFGDKKKIAQVLVVAVLINFSLLFTKVIVDASNFTAYQFYRSMVEGAPAETVTLKANPTGTGFTGAVGTFTETIASETAISARFLQFLGVDGLWDSKKALEDIAAKNPSALYGGLYAIGYGLLAFVFLMATALVFFYGAFLIATRAILIVFLMLTSAAAFALWLIPQGYLGSKFYEWWESLLKAAFFAPILIALLWATMRVAEGITVALSAASEGKVGTLGALAADTSDPNNALAVVGFLLVIGLLFAAIKAASSFSSTIAGFSSTKNLLGGSFGLSARFAGAVASLPLGFAAYRTKNRLNKFAGEDQERAAHAEILARRFEKKGLYGDADKMYKVAQLNKNRATERYKWTGRAGNLANNRLNVMDTKLAKSTMSALGITGRATGASAKGAKGYADRVEERIKATKEAAKAAQPNTKAAEENYRATREHERRTREEAKRNAERLEDALKSAMEHDRVSLSSRQSDAAEELERAHLSREEDRIRNAQAKVSRLADEEKNLRHKRYSVDHEKVDGSVERVNISHNDASELRKTTAKDFEGFKKKLNDDVEELTGALQGVGDEVVRKTAEQQGSFLQRMVGSVSGTRAHIAKKALDELKKSRSTEGRVSELFKEASKQNQSPPPKHEESA